MGWLIAAGYVIVALMTARYLWRSCGIGDRAPVDNDDFWTMLIIPLGWPVAWVIFFIGWFVSGRSPSSWNW